MRIAKKIVRYFIPLLGLSIIWEFCSRNSDKINFLFSSPIAIAVKFWEKTMNGELIMHTSITGFEAIVGLITGVSIGSIIGFSLLYFPRTSNISKPYIVALSSIPIFGIAPMMIIWFGTGLSMKIAMAFFSTVFTAILQAYQGGQDISEEESIFFNLNGATNNQKFWKLVFPSSMNWVLQSLKLNSGLAILGAFIGEFIASEKGLGYIILKASGLYDVTYVLAAIICIILLSALFNFLVSIIEKNKLKIIRKISVRV
ncbi:MAG: ABC transporter permease [Bacteroidales bacterium]|nr:ABC transporter permease [Bacteroidales bacterium]